MRPCGSTRARTRAGGDENQRRFPQCERSRQAFKRRQSRRGPSFLQRRGPRSGASRDTAFSVTSRRLPSSPAHRCARQLNTWPSGLRVRFTDIFVNHALNAAKAHTEKNSSRLGHPDFTEDGTIVLTATSPADLETAKRFV